MLAYYKTDSYTHFEKMKISIQKDLSETTKRMDPIECLRLFGLTRFVEVVDKAGMIEELQSMIALTLFAPTNEAFERLTENDTQRMLNTPITCRALVKDHSVMGFVKLHFDENTFHGYLDTEARSMLGNKATITHRGAPEPKMVHSSSAPNAAAITLYNFETLSGGITIIDAVLGSSENRPLE